MKKILICLFIFILAVFFYLYHRTKVEIKYSENMLKEITVYAIKYETKEVTKVSIDYVEPTIENIVKIYTSKQNLLPIGYFSPVCPNAKLLSYKNNEQIEIIFDRYFVYSYDLKLASLVIEKTIVLIYNKPTIVKYI